MDAALTHSGRITITGSASFTGVQAGIVRGEYKAGPSTVFREDMNRLLDFPPAMGYTLDSISGVKGLDVNEEFSFDLRGKGRSLMLDVDGIYVMQLPMPHLFTLIPELEDSTLLIYGMDVSRYFDVTPLKSVMNLHLPNGLILHSLPRDISFEDPESGNYSLHFTQAEGGIRIERQVFFRHYIIEPGKEAGFMAFYNKVIAADQTILKFRKKP
jgi:hypothetical protein